MCLLAMMLSLLFGYINHQFMIILFAQISLVFKSNGKEDEKKQTK